MNTKYLTWALEVARVTSQLSRDPSTRVGAVLLSSDCRILSTGYNDLPIGVDCSVENYSRPLKYDLIVHAEANVLANACRHGIVTVGASIICTHEPCSSCRKAMIQAGVVCAYYGIAMIGERWKADLDICRKLPLAVQQLT